MSTVQEIEAAIEQLPPDSFRQLRRWIAERDSRNWDSEIAADAASGKFDAIRERVFADDAGRTTDL